MNIRRMGHSRSDGMLALAPVLAGWRDGCQEAVVNLNGDEGQGSAARWNIRRTIVAAVALRMVPVLALADGSRSGMGPGCRWARSR
jgi:hypothetical protein